MADGEEQRAAWERRFVEAAGRVLEQAGWVRCDAAGGVLAPIEGRYFKAPGGQLALTAGLMVYAEEVNSGSLAMRASGWVGVTSPMCERLLAVLPAASTIDAAVIDELDLSVGGAGGTSTRRPTSPSSSSRPITPRCRCCA